jgi:orotidine-5'-phosphate decarboxylase
MLGMDAIEPFISTAISLEKGLFVLVRTSNPGSRDFQDVTLHDGRSWSELVADTLDARIDSAGNFGKHGYCSIGAVVGATQTHTMVSIRKRLPRSIFLLPGYGTQGATGEMTRAAFDDKGKGAIVSASRSILYPKSSGGDWKQDIENAVLAMRGDLETFIRQ